MTGIVSGFDHWSLSVSDLRRSTAFYRDVLGWHPVDTPTLSDDGAWGALPGRQHCPLVRRFVRDGQRVELTAIPKLTFRPRTPQVNHLGLSHLTVATGPTDELLQELQALDVKVRRHTRSSFVPDRESPGNQFLFEDPDGNIIETYESGDDWNSFGIGRSEEHCKTGITHLSHWSLCIRHPATSLFYRDVLGWDEIAVFEWNGRGPSKVMDVGEAELTTWLFGVDTQRVEIIYFAKPSPYDDNQRSGAVTGLSHMTITIEDIRSANRELAAAGTQSSVVRGEIGESLVFTDPDGNLIRGITHEAAWQ